MGRLQLTVLGTGDAFGSAGRLHAAVALQAGGRLLLLDPGPCLLPQLRRARLDPARIDAVLITHLHGDHIAGLPFLFLEYQYRTRRRAPLVVIGPPGTERRLERLAAATYVEVERRRRRFTVRYREIAPQASRRVAGAAIQAVRMEHSEREVCLGYRITWGGKTIAFSGDTGWCAGLVQLARDADLLLTECTNYRDGAAVHLSYADLCAHATELRARRIVLTHVGDDLLRHRHQVKLPIAEDGQTFRV